MLGAQNPRRLTKLALSLCCGERPSRIRRLRGLSGLRCPQFSRLLLRAKCAKGLPGLSLRLSGSKCSRCVRRLRSLRCLCRAHTQLLLSETSRRLSLPKIHQRLRLLRSQLPSRLPKLGQRLHLLPGQLSSSLPKLRELTRPLKDAR